MPDLVEPDKVGALEKLGDGVAAFGIATAWLQAKRELSPSTTDADSAPEASLEAIARSKVAPTRSVSRPSYVIRGAPADRSDDLTA